MRKGNLDDMEKELDELLNKITGGKGKQRFEEFMKEPIMTIKVSRKTTSIECSNCFKHEIEDHIPQVIAHLLGMVDIDKRAKLAAEAITMSALNSDEEGSLNREK